MLSPELKHIEDPRSPLEKFSRKELEYLARFEGRDDIDPAMPVDLMREAFRARPPRQWPRPVLSSIGMNAGRRVTPPYERWKDVAFGQVSAPQPVEIQEINALENLKEQWGQEKAPQPITLESRKDRNQEMYAMHQKGKKNTDIAKEFNVSAARVSQILSRVRRQNGQDTSKRSQ